MKIRDLDTAAPKLLNEALYQAIFVPDGQPKPPRSIIDEPALRVYRTRCVLGVVAEIDGAPVGVAWLCQWTDAERGFGFLAVGIPELSIAVFEGHRGQGVGTALLNALLRQARQDGMTAISLSVSAENPAVRLYERLGFVPVLHEPGGSITMRCALLSDQLAQ